MASANLYFRNGMIDMADNELSKGKRIPVNNHAGHRERLRHDFLERGLEAMHPHQVLELLLFYSIPRIDTNNIAHEMLNKFGSIAGVFNAPIGELRDIHGVSENTIVLLKMIPQLFSLYAASVNEGAVLDTTSKLCKYFLSQLAGVSEEQIIIVCLDDGMRLSKFVRIAKGDSGSVAVENKKIVEAVISSGCTLCAMAHNHPISSCEPTKEDIESTSVLMKVLKYIGVTLSEHIVVGKDGACAIISHETLRQDSDEE